MFNKQKFCHVASNNRNEQKIGLFVYKTTDNLATVSASGYFNEKIIDINLHDLIIHEQYDAVDRTKVSRNLLCVVERTLDNVGTALIKSDWEKTIEETVNQLVQESETYVKTDGSRIMSAPLRMIAGSMRGAIAPYWNGLGFFKVNTDEAQSVTLVASIDDHSGFVPATDGTLKIGGANKKWSSVHALALNNGYDISIPVTNSADTVALKSQVDDAANSGEQLYTTGVWYAKMYSATTIPAEAEVEGRNYADFSQVDGNNDPIIVIYTYTSGAWATTTTITPPKNHNGYMTITSKIWDIQEQAGQQGGLVLWAHNQGTFTPYPRIVSFDNANITNSTFEGSVTLSGDSTVTMPVNPGNSQIVNKDYVDSKIHIFDYNSVTHADIENTRDVSDAPIIIQNNNRSFMYSGEIYTTYYFYGFSGDHISLLAIKSDGTKTVVNYPQINNHVVTEFQEPTAENNYTWYRKYADGWVEQGGVGTTSLSVTLPVTMSDTNYTITLACNNYSPNAGTATAVYYNKATTGFDLQGRWNGNAQSGIDVCWEVKGMYAQP